MPVDSAEWTDSLGLSPVQRMLSRAASNVSYRSNQPKTVSIFGGEREDDFDSSSETDDDASESGDWDHWLYDLSYQSGTKAFSSRSNISKEDFLDFHQGRSPLAVIPQSPADESNNQGNISPKKKLQDFFRGVLLRRF